jgi:reprolysin-like metallo-peptidase family M12B/HYR domain-containing protein
MRKTLIVLSLAFCASLAIADDSLWTLHPRLEAAAVHPRFGRQPLAFQVAAVDEAELRNALTRAPLEAITPAGPQILEAHRQPKPVLSLPMPDGTFIRLAIEESPILSPEMQARYPEIRTYRGQGIDDPAISARLDQTPLGFHAQILNGHDAVYIDPADQPDFYISYWHHDLEGLPFHCYTEPAGRISSLAAHPRPDSTPSGSELRTYRLAVSATGEYTTFFGGVSQAVSQITTTVNRVSGIYESELSIRFTLVATRVFTDKDTDPFTDGDPGTMGGENQTELDTNVGSANYDIGHVLGKAGRGGEAPGLVCANSSKAKGATSLGFPSGDGFDVDFVAHEIGHQLGANHTWDGTSDSNCGDNRENGSAYEPGSGSTIMAYAGTCGAKFNVQTHADPYFHTVSFDEIQRYTHGSLQCGTVTPTANHPPVPNAGADFTIPMSTPFTLTGSATDTDGDPLTFCWEQFDLGPGIALPTFDYNGPLFRSRLGTPSPSRTFPRMQDLINGTPTPFEVLPGTVRDLTFRLTARDKRGGTDYDTAVVHVNGAQFVIAEPNGTLQCNTTSLLRWAGGSGDPEVRALMSTDDGASFTTTLLAATPNDGVELFTVPRFVTNLAWIKLEPINNIYFALMGRLSIVDTIPPTVTPPASAGHVECRQCSPRGARITSAGPASTVDTCDQSPVLSSNAPEVFPLGNTTVTWRGRDASGNVGLAQQFVEIVDTTPPSLTAPENVVAEGTASSGTAVNLGTPVVDDICWCAQVNVQNNAPVLFPLGTTHVTWTATDGSGNSSIATQSVTIQDTTPPALDVELSPNVLWPPNHKFVTIRAKIVTSDISDPTPSVKLLSITSNEPDRDRTTSGQIDAMIGADDQEFRLLAERTGKEGDRIYTVTYESRDASGNFTVKQAIVTVPR